MLVCLDENITDKAHVYWLSSLQMLVYISNIFHRMSSNLYKCMLFLNEIGKKNSKYVFFYFMSYCMFLLTHGRGSGIYSNANVCYLYIRDYYISIVKVAFFLCFIGREHIT